MYVCVCVCVVRAVKILSVILRHCHQLWPPGSVRSERLGSEILHVVTCQEDAFGTVGLAAVGPREHVPAEAAGPAVPHQEAPLWFSLQARRSLCGYFDVAILKLRTF